MSNKNSVSKEIFWLFALVLAFSLALGGWIYFSKRFNPSPLWSQRVGNYQSQAEFTPDGKRFIVASHGLRFFDSKSQIQVANVAAIASNPWSFAISPDGRLIASGHQDNTIHLWSLSSGALIRTLKFHDAIPNLAFSPNGKLLASGSWSKNMSKGKGEICLWNVSNGKLLHHFPDQPSFISDLTFSPDGETLFTAGGEGKVKAWNIADFGMVREFAANKDSLLTVAISSDGKRVAAGGWGEKIHLWNAKTGALDYDLPSDGAEVRDLEFSLDSTQLAVVASREEASIWDLTTRTRTHRFGGYKNTLFSVSFSPDNSLICIGGSDGEVRLWRVE